MEVVIHSSSSLFRQLFWLEIGQQDGASEGEEAAGDDGEDERDDERVVGLGRDLAQAGVGDGGDVDGARGEQHEVGGAVQHQEEAAPHLQGALSKGPSKLTSKGASRYDVCIRGGRGLMT